MAGEMPFKRELISSAELTLARTRASDARAIRPLLATPITQVLYARKAKKPIDESAFDFITPTSAYWAGILMSDGAVVPGRPGETPALVLQLSEPDEDHIDHFKAFLKSEATITRIVAGVTSQGLKRRPAARVAIYSMRLLTVLARYGVTQNKTREANCEIVASHPDFWRGVCDGDGSIRVDSSPTLRIFGSRQLVEYFCDFVHSIYPAAKRKITPQNSIFTAWLHGKSAAIVLDAMYNAGGPALARKRKTAKEFIGMFGLHGKSLDQ